MTRPLSKGVRAYNGSFTLKVHNSTNIPGLWTSDSNLKDQETALKNRGAEAYSRLRPDKPNFNSALAILELKDVPGQLQDAFHDLFRRMSKLPAKDRKRLLASKAGEYHLAIQFGWLPLLSDVINFTKELKQLDGTFKRLLKNEAQWKKRSTTLKDPLEGTPATQSVVNYSSGGRAGLEPVLVTQCYGGTSHRVTTKTVSGKTWATGYFKYFLPPGPRDLKWYNKVARRIFGFQIGPSEVYNLIPWTWLGDYFTDVGHFVDAVSPGVADRLASRMCFVMRTVTYRTFTTGTVTVQTGNDFGQTRTLSAAYSTEATYKGRYAATPFGFGYSQNQLTGSQAAILGALGLSRLP